jgi:hypothetical protein
MRTPSRKYGVRTIGQFDLQLKARSGVDLRSLIGQLRAPAYFLSSLFRRRCFHEMRQERDLGRKSMSVRAFFCSVQAGLRPARPEGIAPVSVLGAEMNFHALRL